MKYLEAIFAAISIVMVFIGLDPLNLYWIVGGLFFSVVSASIHR